MNRASLPNMLSSSRLLLTVVLYLLLLVDFNKAFVIIFILVGLTDLVDGYLARKLNAVTKQGARLDSLADYIFFGSIPIWAIMMFPSSFLTELWSPFILLLVMSIIYGLVRVAAKKPTFYHLTSAKVATGTAFIVGLILFAGYQQAWPVWLATSIVVIAELEELATIAGINAAPKRVKQ